MKGRIHWFDDLSGDGMVSLEDGTSCYLHWSAIENGAESKRMCNGRMKTWKTVEAGWIGEIEMVKDTFWRQISKFKVTEHAKPRKVESSFIDRDQMKAKLVVCDQEFDELYPDSGDLYDQIRALSNKMKLSKKQTERLEALKAEYKEHDRKLLKWSADRSAARVAIYREHSRFFHGLKS